MANKSRKNSQPQPQTGTTVPGTETVTQTRPAHIDSGTKARGSANARTNQTRTQPEPDAITRALGEVVSLRGKTDATAAIAAQISNEKAVQLQLEREARKELETAVKLFGEGDSKAKEASEHEDKGCLKLYELRKQGLMSNDQLTALLGDLWGFKDKTNKDKSVPAGHPNASKTPFKRGEAIKKRIVRAVQANEHVEGKGTAAFFTDLPKSDVSGVLKEMEAGKLGFWAAYEALATVKRKKDAERVKVDMAFDPKKVAHFVEKLSEEGAAKTLIENEELIRAYAGLHSMIAIAIERAASLSKKAA